MGYRSDVAVGIVFADEAKLKDFALKVVAFQPDNVRKALKEYCVPIESEGRLISGYFESTKWYDSYEEVQGHIRLQELAREHGAGTAFLRLGEEDDDNEINFMEPDEWLTDDNEGLEDMMQVLYDNFQFERKIDCPQGGKAVEF
jgi:hypothetical protein